MTIRCNNFGIRHTLGFAIKSYFHYHPKMLILFLLFSIILSFGISIRIIERYYWIGLIKNQCKICRKVIVKRDEKIITFDTMKDCAEFFGFKKGWLQNYVRKYGLNFSYKGYEIKINERG